MQFAKDLLSKLLKGITYSVEHMSVTQWCVLGTLSVVVGFLCLKTNRQ